VPRRSSPRGATGPVWRERLTSELGNLRAALDWFIARADADAALSLASGMAWLWFINSDCVEGARWLGDALGAKGSRRPELAATAQVWHGYCVCMAFSPAAGVLECETATAALSTGDDRVRRAEALVPVRSAICPCVRPWAPSAPMSAPRSRRAHASRTSWRAQACSTILRTSEVAKAMARFPFPVVARLTVRCHVSRFVHEVKRHHPATRFMSKPASDITYN
jgi:hypothetical protein